MGRSGTWVDQAHRFWQGQAHRFWQGTDPVGLQAGKHIISRRADLLSASDLGDTRLLSALLKKQCRADALEDSCIRDHAAHTQGITGFHVSFSPHCREPVSPGACHTIVCNTSNVCVWPPICPQVCHAIEKVRKVPKLIPSYFMKFDANDPQQALQARHSRAGFSSCKGSLSVRAQRRMRLWHASLRSLRSAERTQLNPL